MVAQCSASEYSQLYGGVVAQTVENISTHDPDIAEAVELAARHANLSTVQYSVTNVGKQRLYFTTDGVLPYLYRRQYRDVNGKISVQQSQVVMGLLYSFSIHSNTTKSSGGREVGMNFTVTRDRNKAYHILRQTSIVPGSQATSSANLSKEVPPTSILVHSGKTSDVHTCSIVRIPLPLSLLISQPLNSSSAHSLRVASYNIWNVNSLQRKGEDYETRLSRLTKFIISLNVDLFGFQEVRLEVADDPKPAKSHKNRRRKASAATTTRSQISDLAHGLPGYQFVYQPAMLYMEKFQERKEEGLAIFSRYPIASSNYKLLFKNISDAADTHQRICLHAEVIVPQLGPVHVFVSHLSLSSNTQERSVVEIWEFMQQYSGIKLLMGDMNAEPHSNAIRFLTGEVSIGGLWTSGVHDSWTLPLSNFGKAGFTFSSLEEELVKRIDYIFVSLGSSSRHVRVTTSEVAHEETICNLPCSDHHLLLTVFSPVPS